MIDKDLLERFRFFSEWGGYVVGRRAMCALDLARAEKWMEENELAVHWDEDEYVDVSWMDADQLERLERGVDSLACALLTTAEEAEDREGLQYLNPGATVFASLAGIHLLWNTERC